MSRSSWILVAAGALALACASTPKQAVELSVTVGRDVQAVHEAHVALANRYFDRMEADVNAFVDGTYRPYVIRESMTQFRLIERISDSSRASGADPLTVMDVYVSSVEKKIADFRAEVLAPIRAQRQKVLTALEDAYRRIQDGNAIVTGHLASIVSVQDAQDQMLAAAGLQGLREKLVDSTAEVSDQIAELTRTGQKVGAKLDDVQKQAADTASQIKKVVGTLK